MARVWHGWLEEEEEARLASASLAAGDPTSWFDRLYAAGARGQVPVPWSRRQPHPLLVQWASARDLSGAGQRAVVVGCALGADAEYVAALGFDTTGFDISGTAIRLARQRFGGSAVGYVVADLLDYPQAWLRAYDLVIEIITVQALPDPPRRQAIANVSRLVGPGGTLLVIAAVHDDTTSPTTLPPWPLRRVEIEAFAGDGLTRPGSRSRTLPGSQTSAAGSPSSAATNFRWREPATSSVSVLLRAQAGGLRLRDPGCRRGHGVPVCGGVVVTAAVSSQIRRHGRTVHNRPGVAVCWADIPPLSISGRRCPPS
jgi:hypothetical protein